MTVTEETIGKKLNETKEVITSIKAEKEKKRKKKKMNIRKMSTRKRNTRKRFPR